MLYLLADMSRRANTARVTEVILVVSVAIGALNVEILEGLFLVFLGIPRIMNRTILKMDPMCVCLPPV